MKKLYGFLTISLIGTYVVFLYLDVRRIFTYTTDRYFYAILISGVVLIVAGMIGTFFILKKKKNFLINKSVNEKVKNLITDKKLLAIFALILLGIFIVPIFFLLASLISLFSFKDSFFDKFIDNDIFKPVLLVLTVVLGFALPSGQISSATADQRIGNFNTVALSNNVKTSSNFNTNTKNFSIGDWIASLSYNPDLSFYKDKEVEVTGFIFVPSNLPDDMFIVSRFVIRCCAADATPIGLKVKFDWRSEFQKDQWVKVTGKFDIQNINEFDDLVIIPDKVEKTDIPERPYIN